MVGRRMPPGAGLSIATWRHERQQGTGSSVNVLEIPLDEYEEGLRADGASESLIRKEVAQLKQLQASYKKAQAEEKAKTQRSRQVPEALRPYLDAEKRVQAGASTEDVLGMLR